MTPRAERYLQVLAALDRGALLMVEAAELLGRSVRQLRRLRGAYRSRGAAVLVHGNRGRPAPNRIADDLRARIVTLATTTYADVNHQHLTELLAEREGIVVSRPPVRRILRVAGLRSPRRRRPPRHRRRRERMPQAGLLVQLDGSDHAWLEQRGPRLTLLAVMDDATGEVPPAGGAQRPAAQAAGVMHFPGFHPNAVEFLLAERDAVGIGLDTMSLDFGASKDFKTHVTWLPTGPWGLENLANLAEIPPSGAWVFVGAPKVAGGSGGSSRVFAMW